jgi:hypothetical protein
MTKLGNGKTYGEVSGPQTDLHLVTFSISKTSMRYITKIQLPSGTMGSSPYGASQRAVKG